MARYKIIFTVISVILMTACSQSIPSEYTEADLKKVAQEVIHTFLYLFNISTIKQM